MEIGKQGQIAETIFRESMKCRKCFDQGLAESAFIDVAQPRWIGPGYFGASTKVLIVSLNPGSGNTSKKQRLNEKFRKVLYGYKDGKNNLEDLLAFQEQHIPCWGTPSGRFAEFYMHGMDLPLDNIALANIAWCADKNNKWPKEMLSQCFKLQTGKLIAVIRPDIAILSGSGTHKYASEIEERLVPGCKTICTLHYAHRKGKKVEKKELHRVKAEIALARKG